MSFADLLTTRENEILRILDAIYPEKNRFTVVGGYAVDAYSALPSYSVDCDVVISASDLSTFENLFAANGFVDGGSVYRNESDGLETKKFTKPIGEEKVSIDLSVNGVRCRQTEGVWRAEDISKNSKALNIVGVNSSVPSNVASRELLIAMKLHSGRATDLKDMAMLCDSVDWKLVASLSNTGSYEKILSQIDHAVKEMQLDNFEGQLKSSFGSRKNEKRRIVLAVDGIAQVRRMIENRRKQ